MLWITVPSVGVLPSPQSIMIFFVMLSVRSLFHDAAIEAVCWIGAVVLLLFNTASIVAMIRHYGEDKTHIYSVDIRHLDAGR